VMRPIAAAKSIAVDCRVADDAGRIDVDRERLVQVLSNLVGNAIKFTPVGGRITVAADRAGDRVRFAISDTGPGIAPEEIPHLFDRYWQSAKNARLGAGLGLFIVKGIIDAHGGSIWVESQPGHGTTFYFTIPASAPAELPAVH
jgi:signal transduction histidine kinase